MVPDGESQGERIRALLAEAKEQATIVAPFIKVGALRSILAVIPSSVHVRCVTRWIPREIAAGVSDPEILGVLEERGRFALTLVDSLHAKIYAADEECLAGSANVTLSGFGDAGDNKNIEVLVGATVNDSGVAAALDEIARVERPVGRLEAEAARRLADSLDSQAITAPDGLTVWFPRSRKPESAYNVYRNPPSGYSGAADRILSLDVAFSDIQPGLSEDAFRQAIRELLSQIPLAERLLAETQ